LDPATGELDVIEPKHDRKGALAPVSHRVVPDYRLLGRQRDPLRHVLPRPLAVDHFGRRQEPKPGLKLAVSVLAAGLDLMLGRNEEGHLGPHVAVPILVAHPELHDDEGTLDPAAQPSLHPRSSGSDQGDCPDRHEAPTRA
jgi:hypothetical protein